MILVLCAIGAYTVHNNTFDVVMMMVFGVIGYVMKKCSYPMAPLVLAIVLGDKAEEAFRQSLLASKGSLGVFFSNGLVGSIMTLGLIALFWPRSRAAGRGCRGARESHHLTVRGGKSHCFQRLVAPRAVAPAKGRIVETAAQKAATGPDCVGRITVAARTAAAGRVERARASTDFSGMPA